MFIGSVQIIRHLDSQNQFQMFTLLPGALCSTNMLATIKGLLHTGFCVICAKHFDKYLKFGKIQRPLTWKSVIFTHVL